MQLYVLLVTVLHAETLLLRLAYTFAALDPLWHETDALLDDADGANFGRSGGYSVKKLLR